MKAYSKDIWRSIIKEKKRFFSIVLITVLGVTMLTGIEAACEDLKYSADHFFDQQDLFDIRVVSTLGLTEDDLQELKAIEGVLKAEGDYSETVYVQDGEKRKSVEIKTIKENGLNRPYLLEGELPQKADEIVVSQKYISKTGKTIGDTVTIEEVLTKPDGNEKEAEEPNFIHTTYTITGIVTDVTDVNSDEGAASFRSTATTDFTFFVLEEAVNHDIYTAIDLILENGKELNTYSNEYESYVGQVIDHIESQLKAQREQARYNEIVTKAQNKLSESEAKVREELASAEQQIKEAEEELEQNKASLNQAKAELEMLAAQMTTQDASTMSELEAHQQNLSENEKALAEGEEKLLAARQEFEENKAIAEQELEDARNEIEAIKMAQWYVQDRSSLSGYTNVETDAESIETIGTVFPIIFFVVAVLISLTTITRRVEEERGLIGTYKSLGFTDRDIQRKYIIYALAACILGGILGNLFGFIVLPEILFIVFGVMYQLPEYLLQFNVVNGLGGVLLFMIGIVGATILSCRHELKQMPATLIRPKAPRSGSRVFLERITPLWKHLSFLNKVTARNLFRYKKRLLMTISGIMGCTALVLCGFVIKDSVTELMPLQYEETYQYDLMAVAKSEDNDKLLSYLSENKDIESFINIQADSIKIINQDKEELKVQLIVVPKGQTLESYIHMESIEDRDIELDNNGILVTLNAGEVLDFGKDDLVFLQTLNLEQEEVRVSGLVKNYLGNTVYMTQEVYENLFGEYQPNGVFVNLVDTVSDHSEFADELGKRDGVISVVSTESLKEEFSAAFQLINMVVYILIILAAGLAFTVLFTLSTTNISERERELATIKVLGFYDREVHSYVNKETMILTGIGILLGLPVGYVLGNCLTVILRMPSIHFAVSIYPISYVIATVMSFFFAIVVNLITNRSLDGIEPVEALKSVE